MRRGPLGLEIVHPEYRRIGAEAAPLEEVLTPIYPTTEGVPQARLRSLIDAGAARGRGVRASATGFPQPLLAKLELPSLLDALTMMHRPPREAHLGELLRGRHPAQRRLAFEELLAHQLSLRLLRQNIQSGSGLAACATRLASSSVFLKSLPFALTGAQSRALAEVDRDLAADRPMVRLVQGDVGCGKTVVAAAAAARAVGSGLQAALMAPTELLAEQHAKNFERWFRPLGYSRGAGHGLAAGAHAPQRARSRGQRRDQAGRGHPRAVPGVDGVRAARPGDRRRAASLRRAPAARRCATRARVPARCRTSSS